MGEEEIRAGEQPTRKSSWKKSTKKKDSEKEREGDEKRGREANPDFPGRGWRRVKAEGSKQTRPRAVVRVKDDISYA